MSIMSNMLSKMKTHDVVEFDDMNKETSYYKTNFYSLNAVMSGGLFNTIPKGKATFFVGESQSGKSLLCKKICKNISENYENTNFIWWDIEGAFEDKEEFDNLGIDSDRIIIPDFIKDEKTGEYIPWTVESFSHSLNEWISFVEKVKEKDPNQEFIFIFDSLGELPVNKDITDSDRLDSVSDMGHRAKVIKGRLKPILGKCRTLDITVLGVNHVFDNPSDIFSTLPNISGGHYLKFVAQRILWVRSKDIKNEDNDKSNKKYDGLKIVLFNYKNRKVIKGLNVELLVTYKNGINNYYDIVSLLPDFFPPADKNFRNKKVFYKWYRNMSKDDIKSFIKEKISKDNLEIVEVDDEFNVKLKNVTQKDINDNLKYYFELVKDKSDKNIKSIKIKENKLSKTKDIYKNKDIYFSDEKMKEYDEYLKENLRLSNIEEEIDEEEEYEKFVKFCEENNKKEKNDYDDDSLLGPAILN